MTDVNAKAATDMPLAIRAYHHHLLSIVQKKQGSDWH